MSATAIVLPPLSAAPSTAAPVALFSFGGEPCWGPAGMELPVLNDAPLELWQVHGAVERWQQGELYGAQSADYLYVVTAVEPTPGTLREVTRTAYEQLLQAIAERDYPQLVRCWNYVPDINAGEGDAEQYKQFCWGRAEAIGENCAALPSATGIGSFDGVLRVAVLASRKRSDLRHLENPRQVAAYHYPRQYGPRSPSFARATWIGDRASALLLVSGTASIVEHENRHEDDLPEQLAETRRNIEALLQRATTEHAAGPDLEPAAVRLYLRDPATAAVLLTHFRRLFPGYPAPMLRQGAICRAGLGLEIEAVFRARS